MLALLVSALAAAGAPAAVQEEGSDCSLVTDVETQPIRIAVLYRSDDAGGRHLGGILDAHRAAHPPAAIFACAYVDEDEGLARLERIVQSGDYHLVLGPTDSGIFVSAAERRALFREAHTPVVSALVTAPVENRHDGWLFRTNVGVESRAGALYDHIDASGFRSVAVVYADTSFGRAAEVAFRNEVDNGPAKDYEALRFESAADLRLARRKLDEARPGAVGIFAPREQIEVVRGAVRSIQSGWNGYEPLFFTIVDARTTGLEGLHFVSLAPAARDADGETPDADALRRDEVYGLGYDTAALVFELAAEIGPPQEREAWQHEIRRRLASHLQESPREAAGAMTGMRFRDRENRARPRVLTLQDGRPLDARFHRDVGPLWGLAGLVDVRIVQWADILERRYGYAPWIALVLVALIAGWLSVADLRGWQGGRSRSVVAESPFVALIAFNVVTATSLFAVLAATDFFRWDSLSGALLVGLGYTALLNSTVFKTPTGEAYGIETIYKRIVRWINDRVMVAKSDRENGAIKFIAYTSSRETLADALRSIFRFARTAERREELERKLAEELASDGTDMEHRLHLAQELQAHWTWRQLQDRRFVPADVRANRMVDPDRIVRHCATHLLKADLSGALLRVRREFDEHVARLEAEDAAAAERARKAVETELLLTHTELQRMEVYLRWLFVQYGFRLDSIRKTGLSPADLEWDAFLPGLGERQRERLRRLRARLARAFRRRAPPAPATDVGGGEPHP